MDTLMATWVAADRGGAPPVLTPEMAAQDAAATAALPDAPMGEVLWWCVVETATALDAPVGQVAFRMAWGIQQRLLAKVRRSRRRTTQEVWPGMAALRVCLQFAALWSQVDDETLADDETMTSAADVTAAEKVAVAMADLLECMESCGVRDDVCLRRATALRLVQGIRRIPVRVGRGATAALPATRAACAAAAKPASASFCFEAFSDAMSMDTFLGGVRKIPALQLKRLVARAMGDGFRWFMDVSPEDRAACRAHLPASAYVTETSWAHMSPLMPIVCGSSVLRAYHNFGRSSGQAVFLPWECERRGRPLWIRWADPLKPPSARAAPDRTAPAPGPLAPIAEEEATAGLVEAETKVRTETV